MRKSGLWVAMAALTLAAAGVARADDGYYLDNPELGQPFAVENRAIRMVSEIVVYRTNWFTTVFVFSNLTARAQTVKLGFPIRARYIPVDGDMMITGASNEWGVHFLDAENGFVEPTPALKLEAVTDYFRFASTANGKPLSRTPVIRTASMSDSPTNGRYDVIFTGELSFRPRERIVVTNSYYQRPDEYEDSTDFSEYAVNYVLVSGASWAGTIGDAKIVFYVPRNPFFRIHELPAVRTFFLKFTNDLPLVLQNADDYVFYWHMTNVEPRRDLQVKYGYGYVYQGYFSPDSSFFDPAVNALTNGGSTPALDDFVAVYGRAFAGEETDASEIRRTNFLKIARCLAAFDLTNFTLAARETVPAWIGASVYIVPSRFVINSVEAAYGRKFTDAAWAKFFGRFDWYRPAGNGTGLDAADRALVDSMLEAERKARGATR